MSGQHIVDRSLHVRFGSDVGAAERHRHAGRRQIAGGFTADIRIDVDKIHGCSFSGEFLDDGAPDAAGAAGYERDPASQPSHASD